MGLGFHDEPPSGFRPLPPGGRDKDPAMTHAPGISLSGSRHFQHYEVCLREDGVTLHELGRGTMGVSYKARDVNLDTAVAIKVIGAGLPTQVHARERFRREARAAAQLRHPNVASVFHFGETPAGECFYAMEFIEGETLAARVQREGPLPAALVVEIALQVTAALGAADERGLIHRDLKPANLMLVSNGWRGRPPSRPGPVGSAGSPPSASAPAGPVMVKVIDFGLAKAASGAGSSAASDAPLTQEGGFLGTPAYASPEQAEGGEIDARSDIYSLGVTLWYLLTGKVPFPGRSLSEIYDRQLHRPLPVAQLKDARVPAPLLELLRRMLAADPGKRPASPEKLHEALEHCRAEIAAPVPERLPPKKVTRPPSGKPPGARRMAMVVAGLLLLTAGVAAYALQGRRAHAPNAAGAVAAVPDKSIAVLPLEDRSEDKANAYFAAGIQDDLLCSLARIKDLKVISRSSVMGYRNAATRNLHEISQQLGVVHVLEGSVRCSADRVLVNVALTDTRTGVQLWAEHYDRTLADSLTLQGELATEIAAALQATLSPEEKARVETKPTNNADAYTLYLRGREYQTRPNVILQDNQTAAHLYEQALALDPEFALAHARLSTVLAYIYFNFQPTQELHDRAIAEAAGALRLQPELGEATLAHALCLYWTERDYEGALRELAVAARLLPNNAEIDRYAGGIRRRQGRWGQALASMKHSLSLDPRNAQNARELLRTDCILRDWPAAVQDGQRAVAIAPDNLILQLEKGSVDFWSRGDMTTVRAVLAMVPPGVDPDGEITLGRWEVGMVTRDFDAAEKIVVNSGSETVVTQFGITMPKSYFLGCVALARGDAVRARPLLEAACGPTEAQARALPDDPYRQARLGLLYAYLGHKEEAIRLGLRAVELLPESKDAYLGTSLSAMLALIYARTGEVDRAVTLLDRLLRTPTGLMPGFEGNITQNDLRRRWQWDPLRADPRFQAMVSGPEPKTVYH